MSKSHGGAVWLFVKAAWEYVVCLWKPLQSARSAWSVPAFIALKSTSRASFPSTRGRPGTWPVHTVQSNDHDFSLYAGSLPLPSPSNGLSSGPQLIHVPRTPGREKWAGVTGTLSPIHRRPRGESDRFTPCPHLYSMPGFTPSPVKK